MKDFMVFPEEFQVKPQNPEDAVTSIFDHIQFDI